MYSDHWCLRPSSLPAPAATSQFRPSEVPEFILLAGRAASALRSPECMPSRSLVSSSVSTTKCERPPEAMTTARRSPGSARTARAMAAPTSRQRLGDGWFGA